MREYVVSYEQGQGGLGCLGSGPAGLVAAGDSRDEVEQLIREAIEAHIESLREHGEPVPEPATTVGAVEVAG